jgi:hypothetical protein
MKRAVNNWKAGLEKVVASNNRWEAIAVASRNKWIAAVATTDWWGKIPPNDTTDDDQKNNSIPQPITVPYDYKEDEEIEIPSFEEQLEQFIQDWVSKLINELEKKGYSKEIEEEFELIKKFASRELPNDKHIEDLLIILYDKINLKKGDGNGN